jgi:hypothetical protein
MASPIQFPSEVAQRIYNILLADQLSLVGVDGQIMYGDQDKIAYTPTVCVESGPTDRALAAASQRTENVLRCFIIVYWGKVQDNQVDKLQGELCAENIVRFLDNNLQLELSGDGGVVIHGYVTDIDPGYILRNERRTMMHAIRLTWTGKTKTMLGA